VAGAVRLFLGLLRGSSLPPPPTTNSNATAEDVNFSATDKVFLDDFRVAFAVRSCPRECHPELFVLISMIAFQVNYWRPSSTARSQTSFYLLLTKPDSFAIAWG
jgi:hypothetical protein